VSMLSRLLTRHEEPADGRLQIVPMHRRHLREVLPIEERAYPTPWSRTVFESELQQVASGSRHYVIARRDRELVGYAGLWFVSDPDAPQAHVTNIVVAASARRTGVASALMIELAERAIDRGCAAWTLEVRASSSGAQELYRSFGFAPAGVRRRYYDNTEDAIVMWCHDIQTADYRARLDGIAARFGLDRSTRREGRA
jgi:[ribosomal protein S18]-alanine N-acetyltransferase